MKTEPKNIAISGRLRDVDGKWLDAFTHSFSVDSECKTTNFTAIIESMKFFLAEMKKGNCVAFQVHTYED